MMRSFRTFHVSAVALTLACAAPAALAQSAKGGHAPRPAAPAAPAPAPAPEAPSQTQVLRLSATLAANDAQPVRAGIVWRVFEERAEPNGSHKLVAESQEATPSIPVPDGDYIVHAAYGLAGVAKRVTIDGRSQTERVTLNAGGLKLVDMLGDQHISPQRLTISIYVPEKGNSQAKLVLANAKGGEVICLPEGAYHIVSTLLDNSQGSQGENNATNSVVMADLRVPAGKMIEATLRHRAATMTLKLVNSPGGEALANTSFSVLTPGGDVIRELIGAFPALSLAEGEYVAIARHDGKTFQQTFKVMSTQDRDVEIVAREAAPAPEAPGPSQ